MASHFCSFSIVVEKFLVATSKVFGLHDQLNSLVDLMNWDVILIEYQVHCSDPKTADNVKNPDNAVIEILISKQIGLTYIVPKTERKELEVKY